VLGKKRTVQVRINRHTISVAGQIYQLSNLARVQCWKITPARAKIAYRVLRPAFAMLAGLAIVNVLLVGVRGDTAGALRTFNLVALFAITVATAGRYAHKALRRPEYALLLETTGYPIGLLSSPRQDVIENLVDEIADAIENPPQTPKVINVGDVVLGDQITVSGDNPVGKVLFGA
jgi:hypothetical protein